MKKNRLPRKLKKRLKKKGATIELVSSIASQSIKTIIDFAKQFAKSIIVTPISKGIIAKCIELDIRERERIIRNEIVRPPLEEVVIDRPIRGFNISHYIEEDYPRFDHAADAMNYAMMAMFKDNSYGIRQPSLLVKSTLES